MSTLEFLSIATFKEFPISLLWVCGFNKHNKFNEGDLVFADVGWLDTRVMVVGVVVAGAVVAGVVVAVAAVAGVVVVVMVAAVVMAAMVMAAASAKCKLGWKQHTIHPDTPNDLTSASKYFEMLPDPLRTKESALRLCKSILRCSWNHLKLWRCIQDTSTFELQNSQILELLTSLRRSAGDFKRCWESSAAL